MTRCQYAAWIDAFRWSNLILSSSVSKSKSIKVMKWARQNVIKIEALVTNVRFELSFNEKLAIKLNECGLREGL